MNVGFFGGSFNPPHVSHVLAVSYVLATQPIDRVLVVPCFDHPLGKELAPFTHRRAMCERAFEHLRHVEVSAIEQEMGETSRTLYTLRALTAAHPDWSLRLIIGADILNETERWFGWPEIVRMAPPLVLGRLGHARADAPPLWLGHGTEDVIVHAEDTTILCERMRAVGGRCEFKLYPGLDHADLISTFSPLFRKKASVLDDATAFLHRELG